MSASHWLTDGRYTLPKTTKFTYLTK